MRVLWTGLDEMRHTECASSTAKKNLIKYSKTDLLNYLIFDIFFNMQVHIKLFIICIFIHIGIYLAKSLKFSNILLYSATTIS